MSALDRFKLLESDRPSGTISNLEPSFVSNWTKEYGSVASQASEENYGDPQNRKIKTPIGFAVDIFDAWQGRYFDPRKIVSPTLIIRGDWDKLLTPAKETQDLFETIGAEEKFYVQLPHSTHSILFEKSRFRMYQFVTDFLSNVERSGEYDV
ncbi:MAG: alpha/beta hydrolase [Shinella sp.]|nr:alpha/beta hydrolase [Shinella sp.]